jgi:hypothetical protein
MKKTLLFTLLFSGSLMFAGETTEPSADKKSPLDVTPGISMRKKSSLKNANDESNIAIKMNLTQLAFKNLSFQGEYGFHNKMSVALGFSSLLSRPFPGYLTPSDTYSTEVFSTPYYKGWAVTPEFRFYPGGKDEKPAPNGFHLAAYLRYAKYTLTQTVSYQDTPSSPIYSADAMQTYGGYNVGLMIGRQWIIGDHFSLDWWIVGAGYGKAKYTYSWTVPGANLTPSQQDEIRGSLTDYFDGVSLFGFNSTVETTPNSAKMTVTGLPMYSFRFMGLCLGYAF